MFCDWLSDDKEFDRGAWEMEYVRAGADTDMQGTDVLQMCMLVALIMLSLKL